MDAKSFLRSALGFSLFPGIPLFIVMLFISMMLVLGFMHDTDPKAYGKYITKALGLSGGSWYTLPPDAEEKIIKAGFDPAIVVNEIMANRWINENGGEIDLGMQLSILEGESAGGTNLGTCDGLVSCARFSQQEVESAKWLLQHWEDASIRDWSEIANKMVLPDYSNYIGHCSAGEIGPNGILPSTGVKICEGLSSHPDELVQSCNFFDQRVAPYAKNWWLKAIGYKASQSKEGKFSSLYGWNHSGEYRLKLIARADELNLIIQGWNFNPTPGNVFVLTGGWWQKIAVEVLKYLGLLDADVFPGGTVPNPGPPVPVDGFAHPYPGSFVCGYGYGVPVGNGIHWGIDLCIGNPWFSAPVYAMHSGKVTFARYLSPSESLAGQWWISGNVVAIEGEDKSGNTIWTAYGHGTDGTLKVKEGDTVEAGQMLMMSGTTGFSSGIHLHLGMKINGGWVNPTGYLPGD